MSPTIGWSNQVRTFSTWPCALMVPSILYLPLTVNETSLLVPLGVVVALLVIAALTNPIGVAHTASIRSAAASGAGCAIGAAPFGPGAPMFHAKLPLTSWFCRCSPKNGAPTD